MMGYGLEGPDMLLSGIVGAYLTKKSSGVHSLGSSV